MWEKKGEKKEERNVYSTAALQRTAEESSFLSIPSHCKGLELHAAQDGTIISEYSLYPIISSSWYFETLLIESDVQWKLAGMCHRLVCDL
jgi:hypothetical protein